MAPLDWQHQPSGQRLVLSPELNFQDYILKNRKIVAEARRLSTDDPIVLQNSPFEIVPEAASAINPETGRHKVGILLLHGLYDSAFLLTDVANHLRKHNFLVRSMLLPGHGTIPGDLLDVTHESWLQTCRYGIENLKQSADKVIAISYSTGATLAILESLKDDCLDAIVAFAPAIELNFPSFMLNWHLAISWAYPRARWVTVSEENDPVKYESFTFNSAHQVFQLTDLLKKQNKPLTIPTFAVLTSADRVIKTSSAINYFSQNKNELSKTLVYSNSKKKNYNDPRVEEISGFFPEQRIISLSHVCLALSPENSVYGRNGIYTTHKLSQLPNPSDVTMGELQVSKQKSSNFLRLYFNPDFDNMMEKIEDFILSVVM